MKKILQILWLPILIYFFNITPLATYLYQTQPTFDVFMHAFGGFAIAHMLTSIVRVYKISWWKNIPALWNIIFICGFVMIFGVAWEWYEFLSDTFLKTTHQPSLADTMYDMLFDFSGTLIFSAFSFLLPRNRT